MASTSGVRASIIGVLLCAFPSQLHTCVKTAPSRRLGDNLVRSAGLASGNIATSVLGNGHENVMSDASTTGRAAWRGAPDWVASRNGCAPVVFQERRTRRSGGALVRVSS